VVWVPVASFRPEGDNHVGLDSPDMSSDGADRNLGLNAIPVARAPSYQQPGVLFPGHVTSLGECAFPYLMDQTVGVTLNGFIALAVGGLGSNLGAVIGGRWQDRSGPRVVTITGIVLWGVGNALAAVGPHTAWWFDLTYGVIGGLGLGMAYITPVAVVTKWFPDKRGLASGMVVMGFGIGAFLYSFFVPKIASFAATAKAAGAFTAAKARP